MGRINILMAEDHKVVRQGIRQFLEREPDITVVGEASDGEEAVRLAEQFKPDVIIMDIAMPKLNGIEATKKIKQLQPHAVILILTAYDYEEYIFPILEAGAAGYILKDMSGSDVVDAIRTVYRGESALHPTVARKLLERFRDTDLREEQLRKTDLLTERELEVLKMAAQGMSNKQISNKLFLSVHTVESHFGNIYSKLGLYSRVEAVLEALKRGWFTLADISPPSDLNGGE